MPWIALLFIWRRLNLLARWVHAVIPLLLIFIDVVTFETRTLTVEKMWGRLLRRGTRDVLSAHLRAAQRRVLGC